MKAVLLLLGFLALALGRPIAQDDPRDPDGSRWRTAFPKMTTTTATMANTTTAKKEEPVPTASASTSLSQVADAFEIAGSVIALLVFCTGALVALKKYREQVRANPGEIAEALERLFNSLRVLVNRRRE